MDYTSEIVELYSHTSYLEPKQFQIDIMNSIMNNIDLGKKMQAIKMPNTTGKTIMCNLLAVLLTRKGYKVVIYDPSASGRISKRKERGIKYQFIDMKEKGMSKGEFTSVAQANGGFENMINWDGKNKDILALIKYIADEDKLEKVLENPQVIKTPVVRNGKQSTLGYQPDVWKGWN